MRNLTKTDVLCSFGQRMLQIKPISGGDGSLQRAQAPKRLDVALVGGTTNPISEGLNEPDRKLSGALMRVNHVGEVCAQALYEAQALVARDEGVRRLLLEAAQEEREHLTLTEGRLNELGARPSLLNPLWYAGAFGLGLVAGLSGDKKSLGFVAETERQVEQHLASHLDRLPIADLRSRELVAKMRDDEARHGEQAMQAGGEVLASPVRMAMKLSAKLMTATAHYI